MAVSESDQPTIAQRLEKAKEANATDIVVDGFFLAVYGGALAVLAATGAGPAWLVLTQVMLASKGVDIVGKYLKRQSLKQAARDIEEDPSAGEVRDKVSRLRRFSKKCFIAGAALWGVCALAVLGPLAAAAPVVTPLFVSGIGLLLTGSLSWDRAKGAKVVLEAVDAAQSPALPPAPAASASAAPAAPSKVASLSAGPSFAAVANDDKGAAPAPAAEKTTRSFRMFDF